MLFSPDLPFTSKIPSTSNPTHGGQVGAEASAIPWADLDGARRSHRAPVSARGGHGGHSCCARRRARCSWPSAPSRRRCTRWRGPLSKPHAWGRLGRGGRGMGGGGWRSCVGPWRSRNGKPRRMSLRPRRGATPLRRGGRPPRRSEPQQARAGEGGLRRRAVVRGADCVVQLRRRRRPAGHGAWGSRPILPRAPMAAVRSLSSGATWSSLSTQRPTAAEDTHGQSCAPAPRLRLEMVFIVSALRNSGPSAAPASARWGCTHGAPGPTKMGFWMGGHPDAGAAATRLSAAAGFSPPAAMRVPLAQSVTSSKD
jgi:hypothetical protein